MVGGGGGAVTDSCFLFVTASRSKLTSDPWADGRLPQGTFTGLDIDDGVDECMTCSVFKLSYSIFG